MALDYKTSIVIDLPRAKVIELFDDPANLGKWQRGFQSFEPISGVPGQPGAKSKLVYQMGKRRMEMIETITRRDLPDAFDGTYDAEGVHNIVENRFVEQGPNQTLWESRNVFEMGSPLMKVMGFLLPGMFKKQTQTYAEDFKAFAERGADVRASGAA
ncbi:SRPBCC family protein [Devosia sediminis]|uniref:SRPBCC family protein n=1 Tax=Devosia sediminis TaxID=2798801 RepID=A0A934INP7_9HYPH|nr:SRPBCC family protein [Devosia sediminis]MBJ3784043.1 SRPBCC family protein [Devosia sediminis]